MLTTFSNGCDDAHDSSITHNMDDINEAVKDGLDGSRDDD